MKNRNLQYKILLSLFVLLFLFFLVCDYGIPTASETAVIAAVGVEKSEDGEEFKLTFVTQKMQNDKKENAIFTASAKTVAGGVKQLENQYGLTPKLAYTSLVLVDSEVAGNGIFDAISFFLNTNGVHDSAKILACRGRPSEILQGEKSENGEEKGGLDPLAKILKIAEDRPFAVNPPSLKDFAIDFFAVGKDPILPVISIDKSNGDTMYDLSRAYLFHGDKIVAEISQNQVLAYNLLMGKGREGSFTVEDVPLEGVLTDIRLAIVSANTNISKTITLGTPKIEVKCKLKVGLLDQNNSSKSLHQITGTVADKEEISKAVENFIKENLTKTLTASTKTTADFLGVGRKLARTNKREFENLLTKNKNYLENANIYVSVEVEVLQSHRV